MLVKTVIVPLFCVVALVNCQLVTLQGAPPCTCSAPRVNSPCACNGAVEYLAPVAPAPLAAPCGCNGISALAQLIMQKSLASKACGCAVPNLAVAPNVVERLVPTPVPVRSEVVVNAPLALPPPCSCASPCTCSPSPCACGSAPCCCSGLCNCLPSLPVGCTNPFLPAASPVSAMAPQVVNSVLPPVCPCQNKCLYLRKIPIPPPCI